MPTSFQRIDVDQPIRAEVIHRRSSAWSNSFFISQKRSAIAKGPQDHWSVARIVDSVVRRNAHDRQLTLQQGGTPDPEPGHNRDTGSYLIRRELGVPKGIRTPVAAVKETFWRA
jgi:hypothetical protein